MNRRAFEDFSLGLEAATRRSERAVQRVADSLEAIRRADSGSLAALAKRCSSRPGNEPFAGAIGDLRPDPSMPCKCLPVGRRSGVSWQARRSSTAMLTAGLASVAGVLIAALIAKKALAMRRLWFGGKR